LKREPPRSIRGEIHGSAGEGERNAQAATCAHRRGQAAAGKALLEMERGVWRHHRRGVRQAKRRRVAAGCSKRFAAKPDARASARDYAREDAGRDSSSLSRVALMAAGLKGLVMKSVTPALAATSRWEFSDSVVTMRMGTSS